jgi:hypothetical protein
MCKHEMGRNDEVPKAQIRTQLGRRTELLGRNKNISKFTDLKDQG